MEDSVLMIVGKWKCGDFGRWRFEVCGDEMARFVGFSPETSYAGLVKNALEAFNVKDKRRKPSFSFMYETETTAFTQTKMPPVSITCDVGLREFKKNKLVKKDLNLMLTFKTEDKELDGDGHNPDAKQLNGDGDNPEADCTPSDEILVAQIEEVEANYLAKRKKILDVVCEEGIMVSKSLIVDHIGSTSMDARNCGGPKRNHLGDPVLLESEEEDYDCDFWTELINNDYPPNWDPIEEANLQRQKRKKARVVETAEGRGKVVVDKLLSTGMPELCGQHSEANRVGAVGIVPENDGQVVPADETVGGKRQESPNFSLGLGDFEEIEYNRAQGRSENEEGQQITIFSGEIETNMVVDNVAVSNGAQVRSENEEGQQITIFSGEIETNMAVDNVALSNGRELSRNMVVGEGSGRTHRATPFDFNDDVFVEDSYTYFDAAPVRDNMRGLPSDKANMDLKRGDDAIYVGKVFKDKNEFRKSLSMYAMKRLFHFKMGKSDTKRAIAICSDGSCGWRVYAKNHTNSKNVEVRKVSLKHSCCVGSRANYGKNATSQILADIMKAKFANGKKGPRACEIPSLVLSECNVTISYMKAWHAKEMALLTARGTEEGSYQFLSTYFHLLKTSNPGTLSTVHTTLNKEGATTFKYLFFALGASIAGYKYLRKVIVIDATHMKGKYKGCLVAASGQDGNAQIFPLGFGVIDGENESGWEWFFRELQAFVPDEDGLVFVSDRHAAIYAGLGKVYPRAYHGACAVHLIRNVKHRYKCDGLAKIVDNAARSYTIGDFRYWFEEIKLRRPACAKYLSDIGFEHWSLANFKGRRYNIMSSNISESLNAAMKKAVDYPIAIMVEFIRGMLMTWFYKRRKVAARTTTRCTPEVEDQLIDHLRDSTDCEVISASSWIFQVNDGAGCVFKVDLQNRTCSCRVFDVLMIPCCHAIAAVGVNGVDIHSLVGECYSVNDWARLYEQVILPVPKEMDVNVPSNIKNNGVKPPKTRRGSGRPKKKRILSQGEQMGGKTYHKCSRCSGRGHNKATCKNPI